MTPLAVLLLVFLAVSNTVTDEQTYDSGYEPKPSTSFPSEYKDYQILPGTISPDRRYAFLYPKRSVLFEIRKPRLFLVALDPFRILSQVPTGYSLLAGNAHGYYAASWSKGSSTAVFLVGSRWGPEKVWVLQVGDGNLAKRTDLTAEVRQQVIAAFKKSHAARYNHYYDFVFDEETETLAGWKLDEDGHVAVDTTCTTDPKELDAHRWAVRFKGTWDIAHGKFAQKAVTDISPRSNQALERTADRCENLFSITSTLKPKAQLAVVSGRSACSR